MEIAAQNPPQRRLVPHDDVIQALAANRSDQSSTYGFCQGDRGAVTTSSIPMLFVRATNAPPKIASRSRIQYRGAWSHGNASRICCAVHSSVGCSVTLKCTTRRRSWERTTKTNSTRTVGTVKKSIDAICFAPAGDYARLRACCSPKDCFGPALAPLAALARILSDTIFPLPRLSGASASRGSRWARRRR